MKNNKGFSLVELIVVIAIMAILAAVAIPTFAHFINKAHEASDNDLLNNINYIFSAACLENGVDINDVDAATWSMDDMLVTNVTINGVANQDVVDSFALHFGDMTESKFHFITNLIFDVQKHEFVNTDAVDGVYLNYGNGQIYISSEDLATLKDSTFGGMGMESLLDQLDEVTNIAAGMNNGTLGNVLASQGFLDSASSSLGIDATNMTPEEQRNAIGNKKRELAQEALRRQGKDENNEELLEEAMARIEANAAVLYTAQLTSKMTDEQVSELVTTASRNTIANYMNDSDSATSGKGLAQAALMCGMYTSYVEYKGLDDEVNVGNVLAAMETQDFKDYLDSTQGKADLAGYRASLNMISSSAEDSGAVTELMINGFADPNLKAMLGDATK